MYGELSVHPVPKSQKYKDEQVMIPATALGKLKKRKKSFFCIILQFNSVLKLTAQANTCSWAKGSVLFTLELIEWVSRLLGTSVWLHSKPQLPTTTSSSSRSFLNLPSNPVTTDIIKWTSKQSDKYIGQGPERGQSQEFLSPWSLRDVAPSSWHRRLSGTSQIRCVLVSKWRWKWS